MTLFGDLDGDELSGSQIRRLLGHIGIRPEAIRVALHRLKSDGWILASKQGREAIYRMSPMARSETNAVAPDIYQEAKKNEDGWQFHLVQNVQTTIDTIRLGRNLVLSPTGSRVNADESLVLNAQNESIPAWVAEMLVTEKILQLARELLGVVTSSPDLENDLDKLVFRLLVLHHWRRIALRSGAWAHAHFVPGGDIALCHAKVAGFLAATDRISAKTVTT